MIKINNITYDYKNYLDLLLIGDEDINMINKYIDNCIIYGLFDNDLKSIIAIEEKGKVFEIKNFATYPNFQKKGYGSKLLKYIIENYKKNDTNIILGTGENPKTLNFYKSFGFEYFFTVDNFFKDNYDHEIIEEGIILKDMIYLKI